MKNKTTAYIAAALFNGREAFFNAALAGLLEKRGNRTILPQRDGFEFGNLAKSLARLVPRNEIASAAKNIIYFLDMGVFVPKSDVVVANLDEPVDEGVVVEASYAKLMGKYVIGIRTDARTPYGSGVDPLKGMHIFPAYQCDKFISHNMPCKRRADAEKEMLSLAGKIDNEIKHALIKSQNTNSSPNPQIRRIIGCAGILFDGIRDIHLEKGLNEIAERYVKHKSQLLKAGPISQ